MSDRQALRARIRKTRSELDPSWCAQASARICKEIARTWLYRRARRIGFYLAQGREADLTILLEDAWSSGKQVYLPVLGLRYSGQLWFIPCEPDTPIYKNRFGIDEPMHQPHQRRTNLRQLDMLLMPLVAYDHGGNRLGMGGGFYDKTLSAIQNSCNYWSRPKRIGIAYTLQAVEEIPSETWDVPLDGVATECGLHWFTKEQT